MEWLAGLDAAQIAAAFAATIGASFVRGLAGFGMAILLVPVLALALTPVEAVMIANFLMLFIGLLEIRRLVLGAEKSAWMISGLVALTTAPGLLLLSVTPADLARLLIAMVALSAFALVLLPQRSASVPGSLQTGVTGLTSGILTGFAGMPGPPVVPYYVGRAIPRDTAKASMLLIFTIASIVAIISGSLTGVIDQRVVLLSAGLFPAVIFGNWLGGLAYGRISDTVWRSFVGLVLFAAAFAALTRLF